MQNAVATKPLTGNRLLLRFLGVATTLYLVWFFGYDQWLAKDGRLDGVLCTQIALVSIRVLRALGFAATLDATSAVVVVMNGQPAVVVGAPCNGLVLYALFSGFVVAFPGPWLRKVWFIAVGIILIWCLNVLRIAALAINHSYSHQTVDFNHHYTFTFIVYACIFGLWMLWARRLANAA
ncbi:archaeosortase/exosortase family protein [Hymenobacter sp. BT664]|uniref:Archaeosortase/exosortase family protein n=1 Tax=Hymenobacter montanus TaxID=2771359 RepID=A0A927BEC2_9BACT|nr:archaeosortase/exosortase family protein [Hymenobacter montanus]MBD2768826.1 archaeosortase/exosortase family protein [Hymenobacter montanus]